MLEPSILSHWPQAGYLSAENERRVIEGGMVAEPLAAVAMREGRSGEAGRLSADGLMRRASADALARIVRRRGARLSRKVRARSAEDARAMMSKVSADGVSVSGAGEWFALRKGERRRPPRRRRRQGDRPARPPGGGVAVRCVRRRMPCLRRSIRHLFPGSP